MFFCKENHAKDSIRDGSGDGSFHHHQSQMVDCLLLNLLSHVVLALVYGGMHPYAIAVEAGNPFDKQQIPAHVDVDDRQQRKRSSVPPTNMICGNVVSSCEPPTLTISKGRAMIAQDWLCFGFGLYQRRVRLRRGRKMFSQVFDVHPSDQICPHHRVNSKGETVRRPNSLPDIINSDQ